MKRPIWSPRPEFKWGLLAVIILVLLGGYWLLPIKGQLIIVSGEDLNFLGVWPQIKLDRPTARPGDLVTIRLSDTTPWNQVKLVLDDKEAQLTASQTQSINGVWTWEWRYFAPVRPSYTAVFYRDCQTGCLEIARFGLGERPDGAAQNLTASVSSRALVPTKLGVVFADPERDWHDRAGWSVDLLYMQQPNDTDFNIDSVAQRVKASRRHGLRVLVRLAYDRSQALPPAGDEAALKAYLDFCARLARDNRLSEVYGYIIGSGYNRKSENALSPNQPVTPEWYARVFAGYGLDPTRMDNVVQTMHSANPHLRVLVGPVTPWAGDQSGSLKNTPDAPWLNYMNTLVAYLDEAGRARQGAGQALAGPDGFAIQAAGRPEIAPQPSQEPATDLYLPQWGQAQAGFRVYRDWLHIINSFPTTRYLPVFITSTNTFTSDTQIDPEQNYPTGWLTTALGEINREPQVQSLCWFVDLPYDKWSGFSLRTRQGSLAAAYTEFERLLQR